MIPSQWYAILESIEVKKSKPIGVTRMGEKLVAWRDSVFSAHSMASSTIHTELVAWYRQMGATPSPQRRSRSKHTQLVRRTTLSTSGGVSHTLNTHHYRGLSPYPIQWLRHKDAEMISYSALAPGDVQVYRRIEHAWSLRSLHHKR